jgi:hypothetical protein
MTNLPQEVYKLIPRPDGRDENAPVYATEMYMESSIDNVRLCPGDKLAVYVLVDVLEPEITYPKAKPNDK